MAATCLFRQLLGPPTLKDRDLCKMAVKISTWSALLYLAISNLCTRNWKVNRRNEGITSFSSPASKGSTMLNRKIIHFKKLKRGQVQNEMQNSKKQADLYPKEVRDDIRSTGCGLTLLWDGQRACLHLGLWKQSHLQLHCHLPRSRHLTHELRRWETNIYIYI